MKHVSVAALLSLAATLAAASPAAADPRMETNDNFCHFIMDAANTDNEVFAAGCDSSIATVEVSPTAAEAVSCGSFAASGHGERIVVVPQAAIPVPPGTTLTFTSADSETPCTMVESNGRAYRSYDWRSTISVERTRRKGLVRVRSSLVCRDGRL